MTDAVKICRKFLMTTKQKYKSDAFEAIHSSASALMSVGAIDKATMREYDELCLDLAAEINAQDIKCICE